MSLPLICKQSDDIKGQGGMWTGFRCIQFVAVSELLKERVLKAFYPLAMTLSDDRTLALCFLSIANLAAFHNA